MIKHEELHEIYIEEGFSKNFKFKGIDNKIYLFDASQFNDLMKIYGEEPLLDCMCIVNGTIESMISHKIAKLIK